MTISPEIEALITYLNACGGSDRFESYDASGDPDPVAARALAERLRAKLGANLGVIASVQQSGHRVIMTVLAEAAPV